MNSKSKPMLNYEGQINHLKEKGISFDIMTEEKALEYLKENNNYFKLRAFRKNYEKRLTGKNAGTYIGLDFAMLVDLSTIDMHLRYTSLQIALNCEHFLKVKLLRRVIDHGEDGYQVVLDYFNHLKYSDKKNNTDRYKRLSGELDRNIDNPYCGGIIAACTDGYSIWAFIEVVSLGTLLNFYMFCAGRFGDKDMENDYYLMSAVRELRNATAHNNCIINDLRTADRRHQIDKRMITMMNSIPKSTRKKRLQNERSLQLCTLLYAHHKLASPSAQASVRTLLDDLDKRMRRHSEYYEKNNVITSSYAFWNRIVDIFVPN